MYFIGIRSMIYVYGLKMKSKHWFSIYKHRDISRSFEIHYLHDIMCQIYKYRHQTEYIIGIIHV